MDNYATDVWLMNLFKGWYDPCPLNPNPKIDGLATEWKNNTFVNPPYSDPMSWVNKAIKEHKKHGSTIVLLLRHDSSTKWFATLNEAGAHFMWIAGRLKHRTKRAANFPSMLAILSKNGELDPSQTRLPPL
jgi:hypothetical protein